jgi:hypothetical protein
MLIKVKGRERGEQGYRFCFTLRSQGPSWERLYLMAPAICFLLLRSLALQRWCRRGLSPKKRRYEGGTLVTKKD